MGEVAETVTKKKKGRPSLLDLQKRAIKQQQLQKLHNNDHRSAPPKNPNSLNSGTRSKRRNPNRNRASSGEEEEDDDERREKKHRLLRGFNSHSRRHSPNSKSRGTSHGSGFTGEKASDILQGSPVESGPTTPLPDKKLLLFILDRLQKKDTYGVYSDPVDPEELPDYHEIIDNPMDFSTLRKKLDSGAYSSLEQFEGDVFLICSNAMEYNSSDTVYYRQARAIQELAKKHFENLRQDSDDEEPQTEQQQQQLKVAERGRPPKKQQTEPSCLERTSSEISADALNPGGDSSNKFSSAYNLRRTSVRINHDNETQSGCSVDWENDFPPSVVKAVNKYGMKHFDVDDNRRDTYNNHLSTSTQEPWVLTTLEDELKQLIPVGLNTEYGYTRSLARYGANLGPLAWKNVSRRIETALPAGIKFGLGWVGEDDPPKQTLLVWSLGKQKCSNDLLSGDHSDRIMSPTASVSSAFIGNKRSSSQGVEDTAPARVLKRETEFPSSSSSRQSGSLFKPENSNGLIRGFSGFSQSPMMGFTRQQQPNLSNEAKPGWQQQGLLFPYNKQEFHRFPLDLNARLVSPNSPQNGSSSQQHPDLALQL
ncbi:DNA-binding bromodomain-containing protein [Raphanus sativus]|uniref:Uncharacterized protein LOC108836710 n=1 Tax=Raphanus sativus TaxID=3726 RepID=A0A9W3C1D0_RAPSA|nr:uncharacterized protein LOC108836710 [Raphanus sativus]KAJ4889563.1 DNA-binding bromodomain-containing protein [Raphanus sativus]